MNHETYAAFQHRLDILLEAIDAWSKVEGNHFPIKRYKAEATEIMLILVGDDPRVWKSIRWLQSRYDNDLVIRQEDGQPKVILGGNEQWVFADVVIGDDYGAVDFMRKHAIWRNTGNLYRVDHDGAVEDDPIYAPDPEYKNMVPVFSDAVTCVRCSARPARGMSDGLCETCLMTGTRPRT